MDVKVAEMKDRYGRIYYQLAWDFSFVKQLNKKRLKNCKRESRGKMKMRNRLPSSSQGEGGDSL